MQLAVALLASFILMVLDAGCGEAPAVGIAWHCEPPQPALSCNEPEVRPLLGPDSLECCYNDYSDCPLLSVRPLPGAGRLYDDIEADLLLCYPPELPGLEGKCRQSCWYLDQQSLRDGG